MKKNDNRRKLLKSIFAGSGAIVAAKGLPETWTKPVVDSVVLPAHASTTDDTDSSPIFPVGFKYSLEDVSDTLIPDPAELETAMNDSSLAEILIPSAHATLDFSSTTDYFLAHISGTQFQFSSSRSFNATNNNYWAGGTLTVGQTAALPTKKNCGEDRLYMKHVELVSVDENEAIINVRLVFDPLNINEVVYTRTLEVDFNATPAVCA